LIAGTPEPTGTGEGCLPGQIEFTYPVNGEEIQETVELRGTVNVPDFGFYKYEYSQPDSETWLTIAAGDQQKNDEILGTWNTNLITPGSYLLRLVVVTSDNQTLPACVIEIIVSAP
jgi:hypothetical protein